MILCHEKVLYLLRGKTRLRDMLMSVNYYILHKLFVCEQKNLQKCLLKVI